MKTLQIYPMLNTTPNNFLRTDFNERVLQSAGGCTCRPWDLKCLEGRPWPEGQPDVTVFKTCVDQAQSRGQTNSDAF